MNDSRPSALEDHLGYWLRCLSNLVSHSFAARLEKDGLSVPQWVVLRVLFANEPAALSDIVKEVGVDKSTLSRMIDRLIKKGWVDRLEGPDRRTLSLKLTGVGKKMVLRAGRHADQNDAAFFHTFSSRQREELLATIRKLLDANGWQASKRGREQME